MSDGDPREAALVYIAGTLASLGVAPQPLYVTVRCISLRFLASCKLPIPQRRLDLF